MSLINDALRRASQSEKDRPRRASAPMGMEPVPAARSSRFTVLLTVAVVIVLALAGWFFWQWWGARNNNAAAVVASVAPPVVIPPPVVVPKPPPVVPVAPPKPVPAPIPVVVAPPIEPPKATNEVPVVWPVDLKLNAVFFSKTNPRALINGNLHETGDQIQGVMVKEIEKDKVTVEWNGQTKVLLMDGN